MDQFGTVILRWSVGYNGSPIFFTKKDTIAHLTGNCIRFLNLESGEESFLRSPGDGIEVFAVNTSYNAIAFSEACVDTNIYIYDLEDLSEPRAVLQGAGTLGVSAIAFANNGSLLASYARAPDCTITLWNWPEQRKLCTVGVNDFTCTQLSFNPLNWKQLCGISDRGLVLWTTEEVNQSYHISAQKIHLPPIEGGYEIDLYDDLDRQISRSVSPITSNIRITKTAIAGIVGDESENIELDKRKRCSPKGHCWAQNGLIYCCCAGGQILSINFESSHVSFLYNPIVYSSALEGILMENQPDERLEHPLSELSAGSMECIALHRQGLFIAGQDDFLRCIDASKGDLRISERIPLDNTITSICWSPEYDCLVLGSSEGSISLYHPDTTDGFETLFEGQSGEIVGLDCTKDNESHCVTCKDNGLLQVWSLTKPSCIGKISLQCKATMLKCLPSSSSTVVGTADGRLLLVDLSSPEKPRFVLDRLLHKGPVTALGIGNMGKILVTGSTDERVFIVDATVTSELNVFGYTKIEGEARKISCVHYLDENSSSSWKVLIGVGHSEDAPSFNRLVGLDLTSEALKGRKDVFVDKTGLYRDSVIMKRSYLFRNALCDICAVSRQNAFAIQIHGKKLVKFPVPVSEEQHGNIVLDPSMDSQGHGLEGGCINVSSHLKWLATGAPDGNLILRATGALDNLVTVKAGHRRFDGISHVCFSNDSRSTITVGGDGTLSCWQWEFSVLGKSRAAAAVDAAKSNFDSIRDLRQQQNQYLNGLPELSIDNKTEGMSLLDSASKQQKTWLDLSVAKAHDEEDQKYKDSKNNLRNDIEKLRKQVLDMIDTNSKLPDIEKLDRHEFNMDLDERMKLLGIREEKLKQLRSEIDYENLAKQYIRDLIKRQCWDEMSTKGRSLKAFNTSTEVTNYPMRERTRAEQEELEFVTKQRKLEIVEEKARKENLDAQVAVNPSLVEENHLDEEDLPEDDRKSKETPAITGSLSAVYGGDNELLRSQFTLCTSQEKRHQIVLLEDCIYRLKVAFNKKFDEVFQSKETEIRKITDKNVRIRKIIKDLGIEDAVFEPTWTVDEKPEMLLEVKDEEVTVEKYISEEEQKRLDALALEEAERKKAEKADNARERALGMMMAGRLEANLEEELKKELVKPEFMEKPTSEWTDEEQKAAKEFEKKEQRLKEEREKFRKALEAELKKLQSSITEATSSFDERLSQLFNQKIKTEMVICQEELKIQRLVASLLMEEELDTREAQLLRILEEKKVLKQESSNMVGNVKREFDACKDSYDIIVAEDKTLDKNFRREFADQDQHMVEVLYRLFKRRPRAQKTLKAAVETQADVPSSGGNPFQPRPSSSRAASVAAATLEKAMTELDDDQHMPEGIDHETWRKLVSLRRLKVEKEQQVKSKALILADMNAIYQKRIDEDERLKMEIEHIFKELQRLRDDRLRFNLNLEVQLLLKQGQVELPAPSFINDYTDSILIHRSVVEDLNATIKTLGESKLASMKDSKEFRKGIYQLEWEHKKMHMQADDLQTAARDIQLLRVTKDLQAYLGEGDHSARQQHEVVTLEKTVELHQKMHQRNVKDRTNTLKNLKRLIKKKEEENTSLDGNLEELSLSVAERRNIDHANDDERNETAAEKRMQDIITRRKLVDLAKAQAQEIAVLRAEVERLRMRTFPALVQVDQR